MNEQSAYRWSGVACVGGLVMTVVISCLIGFSSPQEQPAFTPPAGVKIEELNRDPNIFGLGVSRVTVDGVEYLVFETRQNVRVVRHSGQ